MAKHPIRLIQYGMGRVGRALVRLVLSRGKALNLQYVSLADSTGLVWTPEGISNPMLSEFLAHKENGGRILDRRTASHHGETPIVELATGLDATTVLVDCTASSLMNPLLVGARRSGTDVVLANKLPLVGSAASYRSLVQPAPGGLRYEATVGAGLPVIRTLDALLATGDEFLSVRGCFSGTLGYLFSRLEDGTAFSEALEEAWRKGFTEPDPREDLGGLDVARKALILARHVGCQLELADVAVESLFPPEMSQLPLETFMDAVAGLDGDYAGRMLDAQNQGKTLRYVAQVSDGACQVGLEAVPHQGRLGALSGPENAVVFRTARYRDTPLTIAGPGAGPEVTAAGVVSDILDVAGRG
jgi:homoserine dehydrogenase